MDLKEFIDTENAFTVMDSLRREGILTKEDITHASKLDRDGWLAFMYEKCAVDPDEEY